jgi:hypothetical protein
MQSSPAKKTPHSVRSSTFGLSSGSTIPSFRIEDFFLVLHFYSPDRRLPEAYQLTGSELTPRRQAFSSLSDGAATIDTHVEMGSVGSRQESNLSIASKPLALTSNARTQRLLFHYCLPKDVN